MYLYSVFKWNFTEVGAYLAIWVIAYGIVQASVPRLLQHWYHDREPDGASALFWSLILTFIPALIAVGLYQDVQPQGVLIGGLIVFGVVFAFNSALHSYLIVAWSEHDKVSMNVGFYYMANAGGRLLGTVLSG